MHVQSTPVKHQQSSGEAATVGQMNILDPFIKQIIYGVMLEVNSSALNLRLPTWLLAARHMAETASAQPAV